VNSLPPNLKVNALGERVWEKRISGGGGGDYGGGDGGRE